MVEIFSVEKIWRPQGDLNPRRRRERAVSWARLDDGDARKNKIPYQINLVSRDGLEPSTRTLKVYCSTN
jgi:hypothetical protein